MSLIVTVRSAAGILFVSIVDKYLNRFEIKKGMIIGIVAGVISLIMYAQAESVFMLLAATFIAGFTSIVASIYPVTILINRWFVRSRGTALSLCISGTGLATVFVPALTVRIINSYGLSAALYITAAFVGVLGVLAALCLKDRPEDMGMTAYGQGDSVGEVRKINNNTSVSIGKGLTVFVLAAMALQGISSYEATQLFTLHFTNEGFTNVQAASALSMWGGVLTISKLIYGPLADRFGVYKMNYFTMIFATLGVGLCSLAFTGKYFVIMLATFFIGVSFPYNTIGVSLWASSLYRPEEYAKAYQKMSMVQQVGVMLFSFIPGQIAQRTGEYGSSYVMFAVMMFLAHLLVQIVFVKHNKSEKKVSQSELQSEIVTL